MARRLIIDPRAPDAERLREVADALAAGEVVAYPTDTLYGLAVDPRNAVAVHRLFALKGRAPDMAVPVIAADLEQVEAQTGRLTGLDRRLAERFWPGPLSLVIDAWPSLAPGVMSADGTVAVRVPAHAIARAIARLAGHPITATSANRTGAPPPATAGEVLAGLGDAVAMVVDGGPTPGGAPSTIVRVREGRVALVREGAIPWARVLELQQ
jgi:L-threonylcarbamoyladenylate synthase